MNTNFLINNFCKRILHPFWQRMYLFTKLPSAFFSGVRIKSIDADICTVTVPFKWFSQNPFKSTYFACLAMAAEMSTGVLVLAHIYKRTPAISMLVSNIEGGFYKKAVTKTFFTCSDGANIAQAIETAYATKQGVTIKTKAVGKNSEGLVVAEFFITWSFLAKG
jgi:Domain of unknown function (DUF4442)